MRQKIGFPFFLYFSLIAFAVLISIIPDIYHVAITPKGAVFPLIHNHPEDYFSYLSYMYTGFMGRWLITTRVTSEHFAPQFVYTFYVILGQISRIIHIGLPWMYFLARLLFGTLLLTAVLIAVKRIFKETKYRLLALFFVSFGTGFWTIRLQDGQPVINQFLSFWTHFDPLLRTTFLPHHLAATFLGLSSLLLLENALSSRSLKKAAAAGITAILAGLSYHAALTNILGGLMLFCLFSIPFFLLNFRRKKQKIALLIAPLMILLLYFGLACLSLLYILSLTHTTWPWIHSQNLNNRFFFFISLKEYLLGLGPVLPLALLGLPLIFQKRSTLAFMLLFWAAFPFLGLFFLIYFVPQFGNMPYLEATSYIPLGILAVYGIQTIEKAIPKKRFFLPLLFVLFFLYFFPALVSSEKTALSAFSPYFYNQYLPNEVIAGFKWLERNTPPDSVVLAGGYYGAIIPAYSHNYMVFGDEITTYRAAEKSADLDTFFAQKDLLSAEKILKRYDVRYVFYSLDTGFPNPSFVAGLPLLKVFENPIVVIYEVRK